MNGFDGPFCFLGCSLSTANRLKETYLRILHSAMVLLRVVQMLARRFSCYHAVSSDEICLGPEAYSKELSPLGGEAAVGLAK